MDPLSALGVASNILAVVDFAWTILTEARTIYKSSSGLGDEAEFVDTVTHDVSLLGQRLLSSNGTTGELQVLVTESHKIVLELRDAMSSLKTRKKGSKWQSCVSALKETWGRDKVSGLMARLGTLQSRIMMHIQVMIRVDTKTGLSQISTAIKQLDSISKTLEISTSDNLSALENNLRESFEIQNMRGRKIESDVRKLVKHLVYGRSDAQSNKLNQSLPSKSMEMKIFEKTMRKLSDTAIDIEENQKILGSLRFSQIQARHHAIQDAHIETYKWIFQDTVYDKGGKAVRFREWLETRSDAFWIHGKPGSGKSTLMKFLASNESTRTHLLAWAGQKKLLIGKFFFWRAGSSLQKSQQGLLRSLLYEILRQCPELMPVVKIKLRITPGWDSWDDPDYENLLPVLLETIASQPIPIRFCLFIDGLDEFQDEKRSHSDLVKTLQKLDLSEDIKLCIASRPWTVFVDEFNLEAEWNLKLENLTRSDIHRYVNDKFHEHSQFRRLMWKDPQYSKLTGAVTDRAQGVFLWVFLVVRTLLEGLTYHDSFSMLQRRLESFPPDLEDFFQHLIDSVPNVYHRDMVRYFTIPLISPTPPGAAVYSFLDDIERNPTFLSELPWKYLSTQESEDRLDSLRRRLDGISRGLLEIVQPHEDAQTILDYKVDFIHRTVYDYLHESAEIQSLFERIRQKENIMLAVPHAALAVMKTRVSWGIKPDKELWEDFDLRALFAYIKEVLAEKPESAGTLEAMLISFWANYHAEISAVDYHIKRRMFVILAANIDFLPYVESQIAAHPEFLLANADAKETHDAPLLYELIRYNYLGCPLSLRVIEFLLVQGSDPNMMWRGWCLWSAMASRYRHCSRKTEGVVKVSLQAKGEREKNKRGAVCQVARLLILHGADPDKTVSGYDAKDFLRELLPEETVGELVREAKHKRKQDTVRRWRQRLHFFGI